MAPTAPRKLSPEAAAHRDAEAEEQREKASHYRVGDRVKIVHRGHQYHLEKGDVIGFTPTHKVKVLLDYEGKAGRNTTTVKPAFLKTQGFAYTNPPTAEQTERDEKYIADYIEKEGLEFICTKLHVRGWRQEQQKHNPNQRCECSYNSDEWSDEPAVEGISVPTGYYESIGWRNPYPVPYIPNQSYQGVARRGSGSSHSRGSRSDRSDSKPAAK